MEQQRRKEYEQAVGRVRQSLLAQQQLPALSQAGLETHLRETTTQAAEAYNRAGNAQALAEAEDPAVDKLRRDTLSELDKTLADLQAASKLLSDRSDEYAADFRGILERLASQLGQCRTVWAKSDLSSQQARQAANDRLVSLEDAVGDSMSSLESMIAEKPWRAGLVQAQLALRLAGDDPSVRQEDWFKAIAQEAQAQADSAVARADWYSALVAYAGLEQLYPDNPPNEQYRQKVKTARRHVRVLQLYGREDQTQRKDGKPAPADDLLESSQERTDWHDLVSGIDADMVEKAISQLDGYYVTAVDFRQAVGGAMESIRVLVDTPQVRPTFPGLQDEALRRQFEQSLDSQLANLAARERVDHLDLALALNATLQASERTVKLPTEVLCMEFADGFLGELDDFSSIIWPYSVEDFRKQMMGQFYGVGIQISKDPGEPLKVVTPLPDTPAYFAGIKTGDFILAVDGQATDNLSVDKLIRMITGEKGTKVTLRIKRAGRLAPFDVELVRDEIRIRTVKGWRARPDGSYDYLIDPAHRIAYVRLTQFTEQTSADLDGVLADLHKAGVHSMILDLRFNLGGLLRSAADVADEFLRGGRIVSTRGRQTPRNELDADPKGQYQDGNLVVLINEISASAAEIVSGAMKDWRRALIIGERSYGKGSVQNVIALRRGRAILKLTTAYYYLPSDRLLHRQPGQKDWGVDPDVAVYVTPKQMKRWLDIRQRTDLIQDIQPRVLDEDMHKQLEADLQLSTALTLLQLMELQDQPIPAAEPVTASH
jgi:carboxyl-terminal processing protease